MARRGPDGSQHVRRHGRHVAPSHNPTWLLAGIGKARRPLATAVLGLGAVAMLLFAGATVLLHVTTHTVLTGSMRGTFDPGALVLARAVPSSEVRPGDVIVFTPPGADTAYTHRVLTVSGDPSGPVVTTKGDANPAPDAWKARLTEPTVQKVFVSVPKAGEVLLALRSRGLHTLLLGVLGTVLAVSGTRLLLGSPRPRRTTPHPAL